MKFKITLFMLFTGVILLNSCKEKQTVENISFGSDTLSYEIAKQYVKNYEKHAGFVDSVFNENTPENGVKKLPDTRAIWFGIERLEAMVKKIRAEGGDGVRFYLATYNDVYPKDFKEGYTPERKYWGYNTLIMVSTKDSIGQFHRDYYSDVKGPKGFILALGNDIENRGELCPPPVDCRPTGATLIDP